jgi:hypothetical protein
MHNKVTTAVLAVAAAVVLIGGGVAVGASTQHAVKACSKRSTHALALLKHGKCAKGFAKVSLGAQGAQGKRGPAGPGAVSDTLTGPNDDTQRVFPETIAGMQIDTSCGMASGVAISVGPTSGTIDASGTGSADGTLTPVDARGAPSVGRTGTLQADLDIVARANTGAFVHFDLHGTWANSACHYWMVAIPSSAAH